MGHLCSRTAIIFCIVMSVVPSSSGLAADGHANTVGMSMVPIEPGSFLMGSDLPRDHWDEWPAHKVTISRPFHISQTEVTIDQFRQFRPDSEPTPGFGPYAAGVSWHDAVAFCDWLSAKEGKPYRLPTEAEWEYVCRAGSTTLYSSGDQPPLHEQSNAWGVRNLHTGVREWCLDWYGEYPHADQTDPVGPAYGMSRVVRGGLLDDGGRNAERTIFDASSSRASMAPSFGPYRDTSAGEANVLSNTAKVGLLGTWYGNADLTNPKQRDLITRLDNNWINDIARGGVWSARWRGYLKAPHTGEVTFQLSVSSEATLRIGDRDIIDAWSGGGTHTATMQMVAGEKYPVELLYARCGTRETYLKVLWSWLDHELHVIDEKWLSHTERELDLAQADGGAAYMRPGFHNIGFRVVRAPLPGTSPYEPTPSFVQQGVRQNTGLAKIGPDPQRPYFRKRFLLPTPLDNSSSPEIDAVGMHASFRGHNHSPALEVCPNGDVLLVIYTSYREYEPGVSLIASRLRFGADEWDMPDHFADFATVNDHAPLLWTDHASGRICFFWGCPRLIGGFPFQWITSRDDGATWSDVRFPRFEGPIGPHSRQPINTALRDRAGTLLVSSDGNGGRSVLWATRDNGDTWFGTGGRSAGRHTTYALLGNGTTILGMGGKNTDIDGYMPKVISRDSGRNWEVSRTPFPALGTNQRPSVLRLKSGRLLFAGDFQHFRGHKPPTVTERGAYVALSDDDGTTWTIRKLPGAQPHETPKYHGGAATLGYSAARQAPNGLIHLITTMNRPCLHFEFNEAWILARDKEATNVSDTDLMRSAATSIHDVRTHEEYYANGIPHICYSGGVADNGRFLLHGDETWYYSYGGVQREARYELGRKIGTETYYSRGGQKLWQWVYHVDGSAVWTQFWPNDRKKAESTWRNFKCEGTATLWDEQENVLSEKHFVGGVMRD